MKRKKILENIEVLDYAAEGKCIARVDDKVVFIKASAPGDVVDVLINRKRKGFLEGRPITYHKESELRIKPFCQHFDYCGGCQWQHIPYTEELKFKRQQVIDQLQRIGGLENPEVPEILACEEDRHYRNKLEFSFASNRWLTSDEIKRDDVKRGPGLGFHISGHFDKVLDIDECHLQDDTSNRIKNSIRAFALERKMEFFELRKKEGLLRSLTIRNNSKNQWMLIFQFGKKPDQDCIDLMNLLSNEFEEIISIFYVVNTKMNDTYYDLETHHFYGEKVLYERISGLEFRVRPKSFFQVNQKQAEKLYAKALEFCGDLKDKLVYDLYTGTGTIALAAAKTAKKVLGIESVNQAIEDAIWNEKHNNMDNAEFFCGDMRELLSKEFCEKNGYPDVIIVDPPRDGMHKDVVEVLLEMNVPKIVYISCKPSTQARDLAILSEKYEVGRIQPVDMFPRTHHVENILELNLR